MRSTLNPVPIGGVSNSQYNCSFITLRPQTSNLTFFDLPVEITALTSGLIDLKYVTTCTTIDDSGFMVSPAIRLVGVRTCIYAAARFQVFTGPLQWVVQLESEERRYTGDKVCQDHAENMNITYAQINSELLFPCDDGKRVFRRDMALCRQTLLKRARMTSSWYHWRKIDHIFLICSPKRACPSCRLCCVGMRVKRWIFILRFRWS